MDVTDIRLKCLEIVRGTTIDVEQLVAKARILEAYVQSSGAEKVPPKATLHLTKK